MTEPQSPFPGMDPYLEAYWRDVHHRLCTYACDALQPQLRPRYLARLEERLVVETELEDSRSIYPDVKVVQRHPSPHFGSAAHSEGSVALAEPLVVRGLHEPAYEGFIQIIDTTTGGRLVTVIEFLSPSNKLPGEGQALYQQKQRELSEARVSLVEIDLLRGGDYIVQARRDRVPPSHYRINVHRGWKGQEHEYYPIHLDQRLPAIRIPLREQDADVALDLQPLIDQTYRNGAYDQIDYRKAPPPPPLDAASAEWIDDLLRRAGKR
ncbi:MAG TPA: DUF4058 family protein [Tepidisphaeraceae bacterium]|nr:DUF4058 family protein [Tepidisphaeraceae bacterium]